MSRIAGVLLAAGASTRFGQPKQLLDWDGLPLVARAADAILAAGLDPAVAVLGCAAQEVQAALGDRPLRIAMSWRWEAGLSASLQAGLATLPPDVDGAIFVHCDQPFVSADLLRRLVARFEQGDALIVYPSCGGQRSTPVLFSRALFAALAAVSGDQGGRALIERHPDQTAAVEVDDPRLLTDIDSPADYRRLQPTGRRPPLNRPPQHLIIDMDGVLWRGDEPIDGLRAFFDLLHERRLRYILATNNASKEPQQYVAKLARFGVTVDPVSILTSAQATAAYLADHYPAGTPVHVLGSAGLVQAVAERGLIPVEDQAPVVVVGWTQQLTWERLARATLLIRSGAQFIGTNPDVTFPSERGLVPGNGAALAALQAATGTRPLVIGKPEPWLYREAMRRMEASAESTAVIGDRLDTDIAGAARLGLRSILVLSGITSAAELARSAIRPDFVTADIGELARLWQEKT